MKARICKLLITLTAVAIALSPVRVLAGGVDESDYVYLSVKGASEGEYTYALDSMAPESFGTKSEFKVLKDTNHTIYVKDADGNISKSKYDTVSANTTKDETYKYTRKETDDDDGQATVKENIITDGSSKSERVFYTIETDEGAVFYLVIDNTGGAENVYFLDTVKLNDLQALAEEKGSDMTSANDSVSLIESLSEEKKEEIEDLSKGNKAKSGGSILIVVLIAIGGAFYYYLKVYSKKRDEALDLQDARDLDDFEGDFKDDDLEEYAYEGEKVIFDTEDEAEEVGDDFSKENYHYEESTEERGTESRAKKREEIAI